MPDPLQIGMKKRRNLPISQTNTIWIRDMQRIAWLFSNCVLLGASAGRFASACEFREGRAVATVKKSDLDCLLNLMVKIKLIERHGGDAGAERRWLRYQIVESCQANCCTRDELMDQVRAAYDMRYPDGLFISRTTQ